jgi:ammonia channel protein AmtB
LAQNGDAFLSAVTDADGHDDDHGKTLLSSSSNSWGKGIVKDIRRTIKTHWKQEMTNFNSKTIAVSFFLYFACIAPAITFGAIYEKATHNWMGAVEMITATAWCGIVYSLLGGQPMVRTFSTLCV